MKQRSRIRAVLACASCALIASSVLGHGGGVARAQEARLGGYQGRAVSSGLYAFYNPEGLLPTAAPVDLGAPDALATITSGPATFARASAADPGDLLASPDTLLSLAVPGYPQGSVPAYPYRVSATSGFGPPKAESAPAPGLHARAEVQPDGSVAEATMPLAAAPAVANFGSLSARATTKTDGATVTVHSRTEVSEFNLLDILVIDSLVTDLTATSDGTATKLEGGTTVSGASVLGQPVTIDKEGIHGEGAPDLGGLTAALGPIGDLNELLATAGIRVTLAGPVQQGGATTGQLSSSGLRIDLEVSDRTVPILSMLAEGIPALPELAPGAPTADDVLAAAQARHLSRLELGRGAVSLSATLPADPLDLPVAAPVSGGTTLTPTLGLPVANPAALAPLPAAPAPRIAVTSAAVAQVRDFPLGAGVGVLGLLLLFLQPFFGARLARLTNTLLADDAISCPREDR